tara:strand:+ start:2699 stop:2887 length:189 start_codon:yes stop_codon:yes gene_type:complete
MEKSNKRSKTPAWADADDWARVYPKQKRTLTSLDSKVTLLIILWILDKLTMIFLFYLFRGGE